MELLSKKYFSGARRRRRAQSNLVDSVPNLPRAMPSHVLRRSRSLRISLPTSYLLALLHNEARIAGCVSKVSKVSELIHFQSFETSIYYISYTCNSIRGKMCTTISLMGLIFLTCWGVDKSKSKTISKYIYFLNHTKSFGSSVREICRIFLPGAFANLARSAPSLALSASSLEFAAPSLAFHVLWTSHSFWTSLPTSYC